MQKHDRAALKLALALTRDENPGRAAQIDAMLKEDGWEEAATFAAYHCQNQSLHLLPWESPPCWMDEDGDGDKINADAVRLLRQMLDLGISRWHPSPMEAIEEAKKGAA